MNYFDVKIFLKSYGEIPKADWELASPFLVKVEVSQGDYLFEEGDDCDLVGIILEGLFMVTYLKTDGTKKIKRFITSGQTISPMPSIIKKSGASYSAEALGKSNHVVYFHYDDLNKIMNKSHYWERVFRIGLQEALVERENREYELFMLSPEERYRSFLKRYPGLVSELPQYLIASYIGISPVSLSRIRSRT